MISNKNLLLCISAFFTFSPLVLLAPPSAHSKFKITTKEKVLLLGDSLSAERGGLGKRLSENNPPGSASLKVAALCGASPSTFLRDNPSSPCGTFYRDKSGEVDPKHRPNLNQLLTFPDGKPADKVVIQLGTNLFEDVFGQESPKEKQEYVTTQCLKLMEAIQEKNHAVKIIWMAPPKATRYKPSGQPAIDMTQSKGAGGAELVYSGVESAKNRFNRNSLRKGYQSTSMAFDSRVVTNPPKILYNDKGERITDGLHYSGQKQDEWLATTVQKINSF